ncbi:hypothetical protein [Sphingomonas sp.]|uniref:hypothetical protein n=1 Tax=Sphingomonas sp. TaxID=28214 RepID=UPI00286B8993|nr:hypothetical protein [Sphingomonas sp.]
MRALILVAVSALAIAACSKSGSVDNTTNIDQVLAAQNISANDTTAIDAATDDDSNMAADVQFTANASSDSADNAANKH